MASAFGHAVVALTASRLSRFRHFAKGAGWRFWAVAVFCAVMPDFDVIAFAFGIPYASPWGHRGFTHSLVFAALISPLAARASVRGLSLARLRALKLSLFFFIVTATHALLDALTNGGLGVAIFWPFDCARYFFPYRPIEVSPIGIASFFSQQGIAVVRSELLWIGAPCAALLGLQWITRKLKR